MGHAISEAMSIGMVMVEIKDDIDVENENFIGVKVTVETIKEEHKDKFVGIDFSADDDLDDGDADPLVMVTSSEGPKGPPPPRPVNEPPAATSSSSDLSESSSSTTVKGNPKKKLRNKSKKPSEWSPELSFAPPARNQSSPSLCYLSPR